MNNIKSSNLNKKNLLYINAFEKSLKSYFGNLEDKRSIINKLIFYGVKVFNTQSEYLITNRSQVLAAFHFASNIQYLISEITPKEFQRIFPIDKSYNGQKRDVKDYFYTKEYLNSINQDERIGEKVINFLWNYKNREIDDFMKNYMFYLSKLRQFDGYPSVMEEWAKMHNCTTYTRYEDDTGNVYIINNNTGEVTQIGPKGNLKATSHIKNSLLETVICKEQFELNSHLL